MLRPIRSLIAFALVLAACDTPPAEPEVVVPVAGETSVQRQLWEQQEIDNYVFVLGRTCFCEELPPLLVVVHDGLVTDVRVAATGRSAARTLFREMPTVDGLFDSIEEAQASGGPVEALFHPTLGYPMRVTLGTLANDAGVAYSLDQLEPID